MIPQAAIEAHIDVDSARLRRIDARDVRDGVLAIHHYDSGMYLPGDWDEAAQIASDEREALIRLDGDSRTAEQFDEAAFDAAQELAHGLEFGVASAVFALCAGGCPTFSSCSGHGKGEAPYVLFACDAAHVEPISDAALSCGCVLEDSEGFVRLCAPSVTQMIDFADALVAARARFDALEVLVAAEDVRPDDDDP